tara:strand:+ start:1266 stop:1451 length:186 start_codon:yes stop_codon:yes gene_type:complete
MAFKMNNAPFKTGGKRKRARASAKAQVESASKLGMNLDEKKLFKQELEIQRSISKSAKNKK